MAISLRAPPQSGHVRTSTAKTRRSRSAQRSLRVLAGFESAAGKSGEPEPEQPALRSVEPWCDSVGARGPGTIWSRHCAAGASTP